MWKSTYTVFGLFFKKLSSINKWERHSFKNKSNRGKIMLSWPFNYAICLCVSTKTCEKRIFFFKKEEEEEERYWKYLNLDKHQCKTGSTKYKLACPRLDIN